MRQIRQIQYAGILTMIFLFFVKNSSAQQDPMYTQYMDNLLMVNPAYAGSKETGTLLMVARNQWVSFQGAPTTRSFSYNTSINEYKIGLGFSVLSDKIGPLTQTGIYFDYSYFLKVGLKYKLGMGLKGGFSFYRASLTELNTVDPDPIYAKDIFKNFLPNFGIGAYLFSEDTYLGISVPKLLENTINREDYKTEYISKEKLHLYVVAGKKLELGEDIQLKAYSMLKLVRNAPASLDLTSLFGFREKFWVGGMYRIGDSYGFIAQFNITEKLLVGYSYDLTLSDLNAFSNGSHEIMFSYNFNLFSNDKQTSE